MRHLLIDIHVVSSLVGFPHHKFSNSVCLATQRPRGSHAV